MEYVLVPISATEAKRVPLPRGADADAIAAFLAAIPADVWGAADVVPHDTPDFPTED